MREHRTPPLARVMGVGRQQQQFITVELPGVVLHSVYKPPTERVVLPALGHRNLPNIVISNSTTRGYTTIDNNGEAVEHWAEANNLTLIHDANYKNRSTAKAGKVDTIPTSSFQRVCACGIQMTHSKRM